ncbi:uncharacterized protein BKA78DRAFT_90693 [Phyllosticta capitalensis]|uniref:uncharacterized protein n=1 Tax=Phyllosticta capitalensis TaxID=121624 RepID=UPI00313276AF
MRRRPRVICAKPGDRAFTSSTDSRCYCGSSARTRTLAELRRNKMRLHSHFWLLAGHHAQVFSQLRPSNSHDLSSNVGAAWSRYGLFCAQHASHWTIHPPDISSGVIGGATSSGRGWGWGWRTLDADRSNQSITDGPTRFNMASGRHGAAFLRSRVPIELALSSVLPAAVRLRQDSGRKSPARRWRLEGLVGAVPCQCVICPKTFS